MNRLPVVSRIMLIRLGLVFLVLAPPALHASAVTELFERLARMSGHYADDAAKAAAREAMEAAVTKHGSDVVDMVERGGLGLAEAAAIHGDDVWRIARISVEAPAAVAARSESILAVARKWGDDAALLEIKAPGCGQVLGGGLAKADLRVLATVAAPREISRISALASHQAPAELQAAVTLWKRGGGRVLEYLTPGRIAASGFAIAAITAAWRAPEAFVGLVEASLRGFLGPLVTVSSWALVVLALVTFRQPVLWLIRRAAVSLRLSWQASKARA